MKLTAETAETLHEYLCRQGADGGLMNAAYVDLVVSLIREAGPVFTAGDLLSRGGVCHDEDAVNRLIQAAYKANAVKPAGEPGVWLTVDAERLDSRAFIDAAESIRSRLPVPVVVPARNEPEPTGLLTEAQAARKAGVSQKTIRRCIKSGRLPAINYGTGRKCLYRIEPAALAALEPEAEPAPTPRQRRSTRRPALSASAFLPRVS